MFGRFRRLAVFLLLATAFTAKAQVAKHFAVGVSGGFRINSASILVDYNVSHDFTISAEPSLDRYTGFGIGLGASYYLLPHSDIRPFVSALYTRAGGTSSGYDRGNNISTVLKVSDANYFVPMAGARYNLSGADPVTHVSFSFMLRLGYKISNYITPKVSQVSGPPYPEKMNQINNYINNGFVGSIALIIDFGQRVKEDEP